MKNCFSQCNFSQLWIQPELEKQPLRRGSLCRRISFLLNSFQIKAGAQLPFLCCTEAQLVLLCGNEDEIPLYCIQWRTTISFNGTGYMAQLCSSWCCVFRASSRKSQKRQTQLQSRQDNSKAEAHLGYANMQKSRWMEAAGEGRSRKGIGLWIDSLVPSSVSLQRE